MDDLKEQGGSNERHVSEVQHKIAEEGELALPRRTERQSKLTPKMQAYQMEEIDKKEKRLLSLYEQWKIKIRKARETLKEDISDSELANMADEVENGMKEIVKLYHEIRERVPPSTELRRKVDACEAVTRDILKIVLERLSMTGEFDEEDARLHLHQLLTHEYAYSVYGTASRSHASHNSESSIVAKRAEVAAELAAKEVQYRTMQEEIKQKEKIRLMEEQYKREREIQCANLQRLQVEKEMEAARAKLEVYEREIKQENVPQIIQPNDRPSTLNDSSAPPTDLSLLAHAIQESIAANRLPIPTPSVFSGDPIHYIEWRASFQSLIDKKNISSADKLYYLKKYVSGSAQKCLEGTFYRNDEEAYRDGWNKLNRRYGQPFVIQRAFRDKLSKWPKIQAKDAEGLRAFSDFLNACSQAMPHVKGLEVLNDCEENQKLMLKVPDWLAASWNRKVTVALIDGEDFPTFKEFADFVSVEAEIACNPVTSLHALHSSYSFKERKDAREFKGTKANVFSIQTASNNNSSPSNGKAKPRCMWCKRDDHQLPKCLHFREQSLTDKRTYVKENNLCYGCLKPGHNAKECHHRQICDTCKGRHPTCLHDENYKASMGREGHLSLIKKLSNAPEESTAATALNVTRGDQSCITSMIVPVWVSVATDPDKEQLIYALLDTQSDSTFIDKETSYKLQVDTIPVKLKLTTMLGENIIVQSERVLGLRVRGYNSCVHIDLPPAYTKDCIPGNREHIPTHNTARSWPHLRAIAEKVPPLLSCEIGLLIGYNCPRALTPRQVLTGKDSEPYAICTDLGWSVVGSAVPSMDRGDVGLCHKVMVKELPPVTPMDVLGALESDFKDVKDHKVVSQEDLLFLDILKGSIKKNEQGHYEMPLPFRQRPRLPDNRKLAEKRLDHLRRKFSKEERYKADYTTYINEIIERGDVEQVLEKGTLGEQWYIPHHGIYNPKKPDKLRVVFDCSARCGGTSLNDHLLPGPVLINNLTGVPPTDGDVSIQPQDYRLKVHLFGAVSSPGCANYALKYLAKENELLLPVGSQFVARDFYVDDGVTSADTEEKAIRMAQEAREICAKGGLRLHKFISNSQTVLQSIPSSERATDTKTKDLTFSDTQVERALGIQWSVEEDSFRFNNTLTNQPGTRRGILATVASVFDPLGFLAPYVLTGKKILQEMCRQGVDWDEHLPDMLKPQWESWQRDFSNLERIRIARCYVPINFGEVIERELHHFSDASTSGYGQCSYLRVKNQKGETHCSLVMAKARVAPTKLTTIPRLELTAAVVSVAISDILREEMSFAFTKEYFWTDSKVVLSYINNDSRRFHTFVANRVQKIRNSTTPQQWHYVPTDKNPADGASRGRTVSELLESDWFSGPAFLWEREICMFENGTTDLTIGDPEIRQAQTLQTSVLPSSEPLSIADRLIKFSSWSRAIRAVARLVRRAKQIKSNKLSTVSEQQNAEHVIIKDLQKQAYGKEIEHLKKGKQLTKGNKLYQLDVFMDSNGIVKVGGRLHHSTLCDSLKHPIVIPKEHHVTKLIIAHHHEKIQHQGKGLTANAIRSSGYWIPSMSRAVSSCIRQCVVCRRLRRLPEGQRMSDLPEERMEPSPPFTYCGMDCFGPFVTTEGRKQYKRYGLLFTCFCSRAIHLEMLEDMSTDAFINSLRCFIAIRGAVRQIQCDQGTNFIGAKNEFKAALQELNEERLSSFLSQRQCDFVMNAPHSSHAGGVWERQIKTVRSVLSSILALAHNRLRDSVLRTVLYEVMAIVNSRPLTVDTLFSPDSLEPLTPNHLIQMKSISALPPPGTFPREDLYGARRWRQVQYLAEQFWSRWKPEYLHSIMARQKWHSPKRNLQVGDVVMDMDESSPRCEWKLAKVVDIVEGKDGLVRRVKISVGDKRLTKDGKRLSKLSILERPVQKLVLLLEA
ncbi:Pro-Pol polyprotein [Labeo rohita]|uniref:Pro-Pol polyprotein n=2 Tax=Labeo rohita TaxID=84645 RepID=A0ABQ8L6S0_LABRO|nr:Pro-Pol polyprotein [Labeo rohita]